MHSRFVSISGLPRGFCGLVIAAALGTPAPALADASQNGADALRVFVDCDRGCDFTYLRQEIAYLNYVRDRRDAQVHVLVTEERSGSGERRTLEFIGLREFEGIDQTLTFTSSSTDTRDERRRGFARILQLGLVRYVLETPLAAGLRVEYDAPSEQGPVAAQPAEDPWNFWVFRLRLNANFSREDRRDSRFFGASINATRTTDEARMGFGADFDYNESNFEFDNGETFKNLTRNAAIGGQVVKTLGDSWGAGIGASARRSTFLNLSFSYRGAAALQYNFFPFTESTRRKLTLTYFLGLTRFNYEEETIFAKLAETRADHGVLASLDLAQPWGSSGVDFEFSHFLDDLSQRRFTVRGNIEYRIVRGLSFNMFGNYSVIRDQIFLPRRGATDEEVLLQRRALATDSRFFIGFGLGYTFGSIYNNVVNSRITGSSGGFHRIF